MKNPIRQPLKENCGEELQLIFRSIKNTLKNRLDEKYIPTIRAFFHSLPKTNENIHFSYYNALEYLFTSFGGDIMFSPRSANVALKQQTRTYSGMCPITFSGGPISRTQRERKLKELGLFNRRKRKRANDIDEDSTLSAQEEEEISEGNINLLLFLLYYLYVFSCY
jgi:hypothetical protein